MAVPRAPVRPTFLPCIYSRPQVRAPLRATKQIQKTNSCVDARTLRLLLLLTYATGAQRKELVNLRSAEADLDAGVLTLGIGEKNSGMNGALDILRSVHSQAEGKLALHPSDRQAAELDNLFAARLPISKPTHMTTWSKRYRIVRS